MNPNGLPPTDKQPTQLDWARLAAFIDGEGCLSIVHTTAKAKKSGQFTNQNVRVEVFNTDRRLTDWCKITFGGFACPHGRQKKPQHKRAYVWGCADARAEWILVNTKPYMIIKQEQVDICLKFRELIKASKAERAQHKNECSQFVPGIPEGQLAERDELKGKLSLIKRVGVAA